jgi:hypothetical protein
LAVSSRRATLISSTNSSTLARYRAESARRLRLYASTDPKRKMVNEGMTVSKVAARRNAAVSARKAHAQTPTTDASTNPRVTGVGGTAVLNLSSAPLRSVEIACHVLASGRPALRVWGSTT